MPAFIASRRPMVALIAAVGLCVFIDAAAQSGYGVPMPSPNPAPWDVASARVLFDATHEQHARPVPASDAMHASSSGLSGQIPVGIDQLDTLRGGDDITENTVLVEGTVDNNSATHIRSGDNVLSGDAFSTANGINTVIQNSGSNVLIQNGMVVTVRFAELKP